MKFHGLYLYDFQGNVLNSISVINQNKKNLYSLCLKFHNFIQNSKCIETNIPNDSIPLHVWRVPSQSRWAELRSRSRPGGWCGGGQTAAWSLQLEQGVSVHMLLHDYITEQPNIWPQWIKSGVWGQIESVIMYISCLF